MGNLTPTIGTTSTGATTAVVSSATYAAGVLIELLVTTDDGGASPTGSITSTGTAQTWSLIGRANSHVSTNGGGAEIWACVSTGFTGTVTAHNSFSGGQISVTPVVWASSGNAFNSTAASNFGAVTDVDINTASTTHSGSVVTTAANSWVTAVDFNYTTNAAMAATSPAIIPTGKQGNDGAGDQYVILFDTSATVQPSRSSGTTVTMGGTYTAAAQGHLVIAELLDPGGSSPVTELVNAAAIGFAGTTLTTLAGVISTVTAAALTFAGTPVTANNSIVEHASPAAMAWAGAPVSTTTGVVQLPTAGSIAWAGTSVVTVTSGIQPVSSANGNSTSTTPVITFPTGYGATDALILFLSRNQTSTSFTASSEVTSITALSNAGTGRLAAFLVVPNGTGHASFTLTTSASAVNEWWFADYGTGYDLAATVNHAENAVGNSTSSTIAPPEVQLGYIATGNEVAFSAAGVNSTATWTTDSNTVFNTTSGNAAMMVDAQRPTVGELTHLYATMDRGNNGSSRNQQGLSFVLQTDPLGQVNLLANPSFETNGAGLATSWNEEHSTAGAPTYSSTTSNVSDGAVAQRLQYTGQAGDDGTKTLEIYQAPISASPGQQITFSVYLSGSVNTDAIVGIEAFDASNVYISEHDTGIGANVLTSTPTKFTSTFLCPPGTDHVAVYYQVDDIGLTTSVDATLDKATLVVSGIGVPAAGVAWAGAPVSTVAGGAGALHIFTTQTPQSQGFDSNITVGVQFTVDGPETVTTLRYYKTTLTDPQWFGTTISMGLWDGSGTLIASGSYTQTGSEPDGWIDVPVTPASISSGHTYTVGYYVPSSSGYAFTAGELASSIDNAPLHGTSGCFTYATGLTFPTSTSTVNWYADVTLLSADSTQTVTAGSVAWTGTPVSSVADVRELVSAAGMAWSGAKVSTTEADNTIELVSAASIAWAGTTARTVSNVILKTTAGSLAWSGAAPILDIVSELDGTGPVAIAWAGTPVTASGVGSNITQLMTAGGIAFSGTTAKTISNVVELVTAGSVAWSGTTAQTVSSVVELGKPASIAWAGSPVSTTTLVPVVELVTAGSIAWSGTTARTLTGVVETVSAASVAWAGTPVATVGLTNVTEAITAASVAWSGTPVRTTSSQVRVTAAAVAWVGAPVSSAEHATVLRDIRIKVTQGSARWSISSLANRWRISTEDS